MATGELVAMEDIEFGSIVGGNALANAIESRPKCEAVSKDDPNVVERKGCESHP